MWLGSRFAASIPFLDEASSREWVVGDYADVEVVTPHVVWVRVVGEPTDESYRAYIDDVAAAFRSQECFVMLFDTGGLANLPARHREMLTTWLAETEDEFKGRWLGAAFVIRQRMLRGVLSAMHWLSPPYYPHKVVATADDGWAWLQQLLVDAELSPPPVPPHLLRGPAR